MESSSGHYALTFLWTSSAERYCVPQPQATGETKFLSLGRKKCGALKT